MSNSGGVAGTLIDTTGSVATGTTLDAALAMIDDNGAARSLSSARAIFDGTNGGKLAGVVIGAKTAGTYDALRTPSVFKTISVVAVGAETTIWTPAAGKKFRLMGLYLGLSAADRLSLKDNTAGTLIFIGLFPAAAGTLVTFGNGILSAAANNVLTAQSGAAANLTGVVFGTEE